MITIYMDLVGSWWPYAMRMKGSKLHNIEQRDYSQCTGTSTSGVRVSVDLAEGCAYIIGKPKPLGGFDVHHVTCRNGQLTYITKDEAEAMA